jgi:hypothetical protein
VLVPGRLDIRTNSIEPRELVACRIGNFAGVVGRENMM